MDYQPHADELANLLTGENWDLKNPPHDPLILAGLLVQEDLCVIRPDPAGPILDAGLESPFAEWLERRAQAREEAEATGLDADPPVTTQIHCADYFEARDRALLAHATQIDPQGWFFSIPMELQRRVWPTEDFQLARSLVDAPIPEDDLFAGVDERVRV